jgi:hypothetical protein
LRRQPLGNEVISARVFTGEVAATQIRDHLLPRITGPIDFVRTPKPVQWDTDGWYVDIASLEGRPISIELWFDNFATTDGRCLWAGFSSERKRPMRQLIKELPDFQPEKTLNDEDLGSDAEFSKLKQPLNKSLALKRVFENYSSGHSFFGIYDLTNSDVEATVGTRFLKDILRVTPGFQLDDGADDYRAVENRQIVARHLLRERNSELAKRCKVRDDYRCRICSSKFEDTYGDIGREFAEAHHRIPLSKIKGEIENTPVNLITVCANCHRMLHRMSGDPSDIKELTKRFH